MKHLVVIVVGSVLALAIASPSVGQDLAVKGEKVYGAQKCSLCHAIGDKGNKKGPLDGVGTKLKADEIRKWIVSPGEMKAERKPPMKAFDKLPKDDVDALVAYMQSLKK